MYKILKYDDNSVYVTQNNKITKLERNLFDFDIKLGDKVDILEDGEIVVILPHQDEAALGIDGKKSVKSGLLQGILDLFLETLSIHNNDLGNLKKIFSQLLITVYMAWCLIGVIVIEILLFLESLLVFIWRLLIKGLKALNLIDNSKKFIANHKEKSEMRKKDQQDKNSKYIY